MRALRGSKWRLASAAFWEYRVGTRGLRSSLARSFWGMQSIARSHILSRGGGGVLAVHDSLARPDIPFFSAHWHIVIPTLPTASAATVPDDRPSLLQARSHLSF